MNDTETGIKLRGSAVIYSVPSHTTPETKRYRVTLAADPMLSACTCPAFQYRGPCKHIAEVEFHREVSGSSFDPDITELFRSAMGWADNDMDRALDLVKAYLKGARGVL